MGRARLHPSRSLRFSGMTLIEIMIAIAILSMVITLIWSGFSQTSRNKKRVEGQIDQYHAVSMALERMVRELSAAYVSVHLHRSLSLQGMRSSFVGKDSMSGDRLDFNAFSNQRIRQNTWESDQHELSYFLTDNRQGVRVLARREDKGVDNEPRRGGRVETLVEGVEDLQFEYLDPISRTWLKTWDTTQGGVGQPNRLPAQVKITLTLEEPPGGGSGSRVFGTRAVLPMQFALNHARYNP